MDRMSTIYEYDEELDQEQIDRDNAEMFQNTVTIGWDKDGRYMINESQE